MLEKNRKEAIAMARQHSIDMALIDVETSVLSGLNATCAIRESEEARKVHLPIIATTARALKGDWNRCIEAGLGCISLQADSVRRPEENTQTVFPRSDEPGTRKGTAAASS